RPQPGRICDSPAHAGLVVMRRPEFLLRLAAARDLAERIEPGDLGDDVALSVEIIPHRHEFAEVLPEVAERQLGRLVPRARLGAVAVGRRRSGSVRFLRGRLPVDRREEVRQRQAYALDDRLGRARVAALVGVVAPDQHGPVGLLLDTEVGAVAVVAGATAAPLARTGALWVVAAGRELL